MQKKRVIMSNDNANSVGERAFVAFTDHEIKETDEELLKNKRVTTERVIRKHTGLPYCLGGNCAKYQGFDNTYEYLKREHCYICEVYADNEIQTIIREEIREWDYL